ncbi:hypothetical protein GAO09_08510 [Rhizobiales bacterium RZME27]|uniref:Uncharacterized protein n=1 Tax=Endobacterium cereale TaxID=2663029 RepID=A0A6A8AA15_9HYPH|nr:hypothetical protein [Endobacterium cereale]
MLDDGRSYGCWEAIFPDEGDRPPTGYDRFGVRRSVAFEDTIEIFDVTQEFANAGDNLWLRARKMSDEDGSRPWVCESAHRYLHAAHQLMLWDPEVKIDLADSLDEIFEGLDWTPFLSPDDLSVPPVTVSDVEVIGRTDDGEWLLRFRYVNGENSGYELEFVELQRGTLKVRRSEFSALRSHNAAFRGDQLPYVYAALQAQIDAIYPDITKLPSLPWILQTVQEE